MDCPNIKECQLLRLKDDLGLILVDKNFDIGNETVQQINERFTGIEPLRLVRDYPFGGLGKLYFRGVFICDTLEHPDYLMPEGFYRMNMSWSPKFRKNLPEIFVPGHCGVRIHVANDVGDLRGCVGVGVRFPSNPMLKYSSITLDRVLYVIKDSDIRYFNFC